ncbi:hypothetical protein EJ06DRAFT_326132 [Trichodelitschia bisporula]|uniref:Uncharacterized protein n=1 Tax=Trichodelitschia bisporula TaxID=703511 RepID=A0A6G1I530_9PEZI|nr:hypothetical protein EJ06DRAFT_326132 [Trichodelitschia bisporula]
MGLIDKFRGWMEQDGYHRGFWPDILELPRAEITRVEANTKISLLPWDKLSKWVKQRELAVPVTPDNHKRWAMSQKEYDDQEASKHWNSVDPKTQPMLPAVNILDPYSYKRDPSPTAATEVCKLAKKMYQAPPPTPYAGFAGLVQHDLRSTVATLCAQLAWTAPAGVDTVVPMRIDVGPKAPLQYMAVITLDRDDKVRYLRLPLGVDVFGRLDRDALLAFGSGHSINLMHELGARNTPAYLAHKVWTASCRPSDDPMAHVPAYIPELEAALKPLVDRFEAVGGCTLWTPHAFFPVGNLNAAATWVPRYYADYWTLGGCVYTSLDASWRRVMNRNPAALR